MKNLGRAIIPAAVLLLLALFALTESRLGKQETAIRPRQPENQSTTSPSEEVDQATKQKVLADYGKLPMRFEANDGQLDEQVKFVTCGSGYSMFLTVNEAVLSLRRAQGGEP